MLTHTFAIAKIVNKILVGLAGQLKTGRDTGVDRSDFGRCYMYNRCSRSNGVGIEILPIAAVNAALYETDRLGHLLTFLRGSCGRRSRCQRLVAI